MPSSKVIWGSSGIAFLTSIAAIEIPKMTKIKQSHQGIPLETRDGATMDLDGVGFGDIV